MREQANGGMRPSAHPAKLLHVQRRLLAALLALSLASAGAPAASTAARSPPPSCPEGPYAVRAGDTPFSIAPPFRTRTDVLAEGAVAAGVLRGTLVLKGYGDPLLGSRELRALAKSVRQHGIERVTAGIVGDESFFDTARTAEGWKPSFYKDESPP